jgi:hypothetical protein
MESVTSPPAEPPPSAVALSPWTGLILALIAGAAVWGVIQGVHPVFTVPEEFHSAMGAGEAAFARTQRAQDRVDQQHAMLYGGSLGLLIGLALGLREATLRRSWLPPVFAAPLGGLGGTLGGFLGCLVYEYVRRDVGQAELVHTIAGQLLLGVSLGLGVGLGLGLSTRTAIGTIYAALGGLAAAILAGVLYPVAVSILLPAASTDALVPVERETQLFWLAVTSGSIGLCIPIAGRRRNSRRLAPRDASSRGA